MTLPPLPITCTFNDFDSSFDYKKWGQMTFPDCFLVDKDDSVKRIMKVTSG